MIGLYLAESNRFHQQIKDNRATHNLKGTVLERPCAPTLNEALSLTDEILYSTFVPPVLPTDEYTQDDLYADLESVFDELCAPKANPKAYGASHQAPTIELTKNAIFDGMLDLWVSDPNSFDPFECLPKANTISPTRLVRGMTRVYC